MKKLLLILCCFTLALITRAQDTVSIPQSELEEFFSALDTLEQQDSIKSLLIRDLEFQVINYKTLANQDSTLLLYHRQEIGLLNDQIKLYNDRLKVVDKWYNKRWVGTMMGIIGTSSAIYLASQLD